MVTGTVTVTEASDWVTVVGPTPSQRPVVEDTTITRASSA